MMMSRNILENFLADCWVAAPILETQCHHEGETEGKFEAASTHRK